MDKSIRKRNNITITNDKSCLSKEDIEHIVQEAEKYKTEDEKKMDKVFSKNSVAFYAFNMKSATEMRNFKARSMMKLNSRSLTNVMKSSTDWINQTLENEEFEHLQKDLEKA